MKFEIGDTIPGMGTVNGIQTSKHGTIYSVNERTYTEADAKAALDRYMNRELCHPFVGMDLSNMPDATEYAKPTDGLGKLANEELRTKACLMGACTPDFSGRKHTCPLFGRPHLTCSNDVREHPELRQTLIDYIRAETTAEPATPEAKPEPRFKAGDKVKVIGNTCLHGYSIGTTVTLTTPKIDGALSKNQPAWDVKEGAYYISERDIEPYTEPKPTGQPVKLYCVKSDTPGEWMTRGKTYELSGGVIRFDDGYEGCGNGSLDAFFSINKMWRGNLVPLMSRPAKAGEWVVPTVGDAHTTKGEIYPVLESPWPFKDNSIRVKPGGHGGILTIDEYLVLDGYDGRYEQIEPKLYNGQGGVRME